MWPQPCRSCFDWLVGRRFGLSLLALWWERFTFFNVLRCKGPLFFERPGLSLPCGCFLNVFPVAQVKPVRAAPSAHCAVPTAPVPPLFLLWILCCGRTGPYGYNQINLWPRFLHSGKFDFFGFGMLFWGCDTARPAPRDCYTAPLYQCIFTDLAGLIYRNRFDILH